ncbi:cytochrome c oxidase subunit II [Kovacikia minuta CCNUW1]|uniref:cytochrome c oxidase subunit II n=1 Tax=Kovacikia minuta TaxID=2931930 RepID=UPI001CCC43AF|nr:cytochrome c oxidase subunit II [Kovacikia minuta]UBF29316.1 cytochrome c oxidase subunit II [Kovacikia minuta CCNUW1]
MKLSNILTLVAIAAVLVLASLWMAHQSHSWLPPVATEEARLVDELFSLLVGLGTFIFLGVSGFIFYSVLTQRTSRFDLSDGPPIEGNTTLEIVWTGIPILLVFFIAGYSYHIYEKMAIRGPMEIVHLHTPLEMQTAYAAPLNSEPVEEIEVHAKQWAWSFHYPEKNVTSSELHLPANHRVKLAMQTEDVIHGFYVPDFRLKQDIIPNRTIDFEFTPIREGKYRLNDSQFSGTYFAIMQANVVVESPEQYDQWLNQTATQKLVPANNQPFDEYTKRSKKGLRSGWKTVPPAPPPLVNHAGEL